MSQVRVRFAPAPTGYLHVGVAHTALFNWLFARHNKGNFILRIEDTDVLRSTPESLQAILEDLKWLGLFWDEGPEVGGPYGPYFQSQRLQIYQEYARKLLNRGSAYLCYCLPEELEARRKQMLAKGVEPKYDGKCRDLPPEEAKKYQSEGRKPVIRFKRPTEGTTKFIDLIRGELRFENSLLDDFVILKSNGWPTYNFACVVDDTLMQITHVIRAEEHISNTPRQILLYQSLGLPLPQFAHVPLILGKDRTKLSKRHGATSISWYREKGFLPEVMVNFLALLGWAPGEEREIFSLEELIEKFTIEAVGKAPAVFDLEKLEWMNGYYIRNSNLDQLVELSIPYLREAGLIEGEISVKDKEWLKKVISLEQERIKLLSEVPYVTQFFFEDQVSYDEEAKQKWLSGDWVPEVLRKAQQRLETLVEFTPENIERELRSLSAELNLSTPKVFHPVRVATTGRTFGPGLFETLSVLGKEKTLSRLREAIKYTSK